MTNTCKTCKYWQIDKPNEDEGYRECHETYGINAGVHRGEMKIRFVYRETHEDSWCYKHEQRPGLKRIDNTTGTEGVTP